MEPNPRLYIWSDSDCVLYWMKELPVLHEEEFSERYEQAKATAVRFADQAAARYAIFISNGVLLNGHKPNTIYTIEGYGVDYDNGCHNNECDKQSCLFGDHYCEWQTGKPTATLKRINEAGESKKYTWHNVWDEWTEYALGTGKAVYDIYEYNAFLKRKIEYPPKQ